MLGEGKTVPEVAKGLEVSENTFHRWRNQYGGIKANDAKGLKELERENVQLKRLVADKELEILAQRRSRRETSEPGPEAQGGPHAGGPPEAFRASGVRDRRTTQINPAPRADDPPRRSGAAQAPGEISAGYPRWGYRRAHAQLLLEGVEVNRKRMQRLWREEGLRVPAKKRKRRRLGESTAEGAARLSACRPNHIWALDFQHDATTDGRELKLLNVVDEFTRESLAIECERTIDADQTVEILKPEFRS